jgi:hypothetical protein
LLGARLFFIDGYWVNLEIQTYLKEKK